ncbi:MAG: hypothetical protein JST48_15205 [Bacteroidetes bacterium]|nr:hypothetical protein [Bacteroidota bacterium]
MKLLSVVSVVLIFALVYFLAKRGGATRNKLFWSAFAYHALLGLSVGLVYRFYYSANDTWVFFDNASKLANLAIRDFQVYLKILFDFSEAQNPIIEIEDFRSIIFIKILSLFCLASGNNYWVCTLYFSLISFLSSWFLFQRIIKFFLDSTAAATLAFLFFPSVVFWSSGIEKETLSLASLYVLSAILLNVFYERKIRSSLWAMGLVATLIVWTLKYYWAAVFFVAGLSLLLVQVLVKKYPRAQNHFTLFYLVCLTVLGIGASFLHPNFNLRYVLEVVVSNHDEFVAISSNENLIHYDNLSPTVTSALINAPWALVSGLFRPFINEGQGAFGFLASVENFFILLLFFGSFGIFIQKMKRPSLLFLSVACYSTVLCIFLAIATPNLGTLSRYRVGFLPFLVFILAYKNPLVDVVVKRLNVKV